MGVPFIAPRFCTSLAPLETRETALSTEGLSFERWLDRARLRRERSSIHQISVLEAAFRFLEHGGHVPAIGPLPEGVSPYRRAMSGGRGSLGIVVQTIHQFAPTVFGVGVFSECNESIVIEASVQFDAKLFA